MRGSLAMLALALVGCGAVVRAQDDGGGVDAPFPGRDAVSSVDRVTPLGDTGVISMPDASVGIDSGTAIDASVRDTGVATDSGVSGPDAMPGNARGEWRMTTFRFNLNGAPTQLTDTNRSLPGDPTNRYRINGTLDVTDNTLAFAWGVVRNDHAFVSDPSVEIDEGYSATAFFWNGMLDDIAQRFVVGAVSLDFGFESANVLRLSSARDGWTALFVRDARTAQPPMPGTTFDGLAVQISASTSDRFVRPRVALLWDLPGGAGIAESASAAVTLGPSGSTTYRMLVPSLPMNAVGTVNGAQVAFAHIVIYDDVDGSNRFNSSMAGGTGPDILRGVSPLGIAVLLGGAPDPMFSSTPFRLLKAGWQFVNVERNSDPRPAVLVPYSMTNPMRPDVPISETAVRRRILDLVP